MSTATAKAKLKKELQYYDTKHSPFLELKTPFTLWEAIKMTLLIWLVPIRLVVGVGAILVLASLSFVAAYNQDINKPLAKWRRKVVVAASKCAGIVLLALGFRVRIRGYENYAKARAVGAMGVFNHSAWVDAIVLMWLFAPSGVSLASNADIPLIGTCIKAFQNIYVSRASHGSAGPDGEDAEAAASGGGEKTPSVSALIATRAKDVRFPMLVAAPEGTCSDGRCLLHFRSGCFLPGVPLLPILMSYDKTCHNPAWTIINEGWHFLRLVCQFYNTLDVRILPPYMPSPSEKRDARLYASNVRQLFAHSLQLPLVEETVQHYAALRRAGVGVSWDGTEVTAPPGVLDAAGTADLLKRRSRSARS